MEAGDLDWNDFRFFLAVARDGTLTGAARMLGMDIATIARRIASLEAALGSKLFDRSPQGYKLSVFGEALLLPAERVEFDIIGAKARIDDLQEHAIGSLRIGATDAFGTYFLAPRLHKLRKELSGMHIELVALTRTFSLSKREADIAIGITRPDQGRLYTRKLADLHMGFYASVEYLAAKPEITCIDDLLDHDVISWVDSLIYTQELNYLREIDFRIIPKYGCSNLVAQLKAATGGSGLCILPHFMAIREPVLRRILVDDVNVVLPYHLVVHAELHDLWHIRKTIDFIVAEIGDAQSEFSV